MLDKGKNGFDKAMVEEGWRNMSQILDQELPTKKKNRKFLWWWFSGVGVAAIALSLLWATGGQRMEQRLSVPAGTNDPIVSKEAAVITPQVPKNVSPTAQKVVEKGTHIKQAIHQPVLINKKDAVWVTPPNAIDIGSNSLVTKIREDGPLAVLEKKSLLEKAAVSTPIQQAALLQKLPLKKLEVVPVKRTLSLNPGRMKNSGKNQVYLAVDALGNTNPLSWAGMALEAGLIVNGSGRLNLSAGIGYARKTLSLKYESVGIITEYDESTSIGANADSRSATVNPGFVYPDRLGYNGERLNASEVQMSQNFYSTRAYVYLPVRLGYRLNSRFFLQAGIQLAYIGKVVNFIYAGNYSLLDNFTRKNFSANSQEFNGLYNSTSFFQEEADSQVIGYNSTVVNPVSIHRWLMSVDFRLGYQINRKWSTTLQLNYQLTPESTNLKLIKRNTQLNIGWGVSRTF